MYPRFARQRIRAALADTRVVLVIGPRQSGKTTLVRACADDAMPFLTLDDASTLAAASADPTGFVRGLDRAVIDEVQRSPELLLAIKQSVDDDPRPGRFLLTGSADVMTLPRVADSLAGRMEIVRLLPLAQAELRAERPPTFLARAFAGQVPPPGALLTGDDLVQAVLAGGYPEALQRPAWARRRRWLLDYAEAILQRDVHDLAQIEHVQHMPRLLRVLAHHAGQLVNYTSVGGALGLNRVTTQKYLGLIEQLFLSRTLAPWSSNALKRLIKTPKLHFLDAGLLAALRDLSPDRVRADRSAFGPVLESFVLAELLKLASWADDRHDFFHYRDKDGNEVDVVIEDGAGRVVGVEVKASATATPADFAGLRRLADACGDRFALGMVLYDHDVVVPFGERLFAVPLPALWG
ncbi:MAG: ATP-binding protein [Myxococcales bacterium]|nr:ATP-binding protein [Myxococcales bacterium]